MKVTAILGFLVLFFASGCASTPRGPILRPIPPPPATPPPGEVFAPLPVAATTNAFPNTNVVSNQQGYQVTTNFAPNVTLQNAPGTESTGQAPDPSVAVPQYEVVPERPGYDYEWVDGYWSWQGGRYVWVSGRWLWRPQPPQIIVTPGFYWGPRYYYGRPRHHHFPHHHFPHHRSWRRR